MKTFNSILILIGIAIGLLIALISHESIKCRQYDEGLQNGFKKKFQTTYILKENKIIIV